MKPSPVMLTRLTHIAAAFYNLLFVYTPLHEWQYGFSVVQYVSMPALILSGIGMVHLKKNKGLSTSCLTR